MGARVVEDSSRTVCQGRSFISTHPAAYPGGGWDCRTSQAVNRNPCTDGPLRRSEAALAWQTPKEARKSKVEAGRIRHSLPWNAQTSCPDSFDEFLDPFGAVPGRRLRRKDDDAFSQQLKALEALDAKFSTIAGRLSLSEGQGIEASASQVSASESTKELNCEWMYGVAATGCTAGIHALAHLNPLRWSGATPIGKVIEDLRELQQKGDHPIIVRVPPGVMTKQVELNNIEEAIHYLESKARGATEEEIEFEAQLREEAAQAKQLREELGQAEEAIGKLMAGADGGSGGLAFGV